MSTGISIEIWLVNINQTSRFMELQNKESTELMFKKMEAEVKRFDFINTPSEILRQDIQQKEMMSLAGKISRNDSSSSIDDDEFNLKD